MAGSGGYLRVFSPESFSPVVVGSASKKERDGVDQARLASVKKVTRINSGLSKHAGTILRNRRTEDHRRGVLHHVYFALCL